MGPTWRREDGPTPRCISTWSKYGAIRDGDRASLPVSSHQRSSTELGVRKAVPPFTAVEPPTILPTKIGKLAFPSANTGR
jgi:hypothetical protein